MQLAGEHNVAPTIVSVGTIRKPVDGGPARGRVAATPSPSQRSSGGVGIRMTLRSTLAVPLAVHSGCSYTSSLFPAHLSSDNSNNNSDLASGVDVTDPLEQQLVLVKQCVRDMREVLLLAREWHSIVSADSPDRERGEGGPVSQEGAAVRLVKAVMEFEAASSGAGKAAAAAIHETAVDVRGQALCLLSQHNAADQGNSSSGTGGDEGGNSEHSDTEGVEEEEEAASCEGTGSDDDGERGEEDNRTRALPPFLRFRELFSRKDARGQCRGSGVPPLLSEQLRYAPLIEDMGTLARHLMVPLDVVRHHQRLWLFTSEDVKYTLEEHLYHHRVARRPSLTQSTESGRGMPAGHVRRLWSELWELLGASWRQRQRLLGAYSAAIPPSIVPAHCTGNGGVPVTASSSSSSSPPLPEESARAMLLTNTKSLPPFLLPAVGDGTQKKREAETAASVTLRIIAAPPSPDASPYQKERYARHVARFWRSQANVFLKVENAHRRASARKREAAATSPSPPTGLRQVAAQRPCATGPDAALSLFGSQIYAAEDSLSIGPFTPTKIGLLMLGCGGGGDCGSGTQYVVREPLDSLWRAMRCCQAPSPSSSPAADDPLGLLTCWPFFDPSTADVAAGAAVPYMAPEMYVELCEARQHTGRLRRVATHSFSDDAWSLAVVVLEAALTGFSLATSHLSPDPSAATSHLDDSSSVFADTAKLLMRAHGVGVAAAHNFLYATLHHFSRLVTHEEEESTTATEHSTSTSTSSEAHGKPSPLQLAREWRDYLAENYGDDFTCGFGQELCLCGLRWQREDRWQAFRNAHAPSSLSLTASPASSPSAPSHRQTQQAPSLVMTSAAGGVGRGEAAAATAPLTMHVVAAPPAHEPLTPTSPGSPPYRSSSSKRGSASRRGASAATAFPSVTALHGATSTMSLDELAAAMPDAGGATSSKVNSALDTPLAPDRHSSSAATAAAAAAGSSPNRIVRSRRHSQAVTSSGSHAQKLLDRTERQLDLLRVPLLPVLPPEAPPSPPFPSSSPAPLPQRGQEQQQLQGFWTTQELWWQLTRWRRQVEQAAVHVSGSQSGAVGPQRQSMLFTEMVRLGREAILLSCDKDGTHEARYAVANHPFIRGVIERGQLPTYAALVPTAAVSAAWERGDAPPPPRPSLPLSTPSLFISLTSLQTLFARVEDTGRQARRAHEQLPGPSSSPPQRQHQQYQPQHRVGSLQVLLGSTKRTRFSGVAPKGVGAHGVAGQMQQPQQPTTAALRRAAWGLMREVDVNLALQLHITAHLRALLLSSGSGAAVRGYLIGLQQSMQVCLVPLPATIRGEVWGALLGVPGPRKREALCAGLGAVHRTSADRQIAVDTPRCHQYHPLLSTEEGQEKLQRVLKAWLAMPRDVALGYWQGLDSVCAILLTANYSDEALALAELDAVVRLFVAHQDAALTTATATASPHPRTVGSGGASPLPFALHPSRAPPTAATTTTTMVPPPATSPSSMEDALRQFGITLRYCDPLLATHIFRLDCPPQLFAISWLLTLFAHSLPARQVYLLWDFLFLYAHDYPHCIMCMCCAFLLQKRTSIMGQDASGVLAALGSGGGGSGGSSGPQGSPTSSSSDGSGGVNITDVVLVLADTAVLMRSIPPCVGYQPDACDVGVCGTGDVRGGTERQHAPTTSRSWQSMVRSSDVAFMDVATLLAALEHLRKARPVEARHAETSASGWLRQAMERPWWGSGVYLVDVRDDRAASAAAAENGGEEMYRVLGALRLPLPPPPLTRVAAAGNSPGPRRPRPTNEATSPDEDDAPAHAAALADWERRVSEVAAEVVRQLRNPAMAAVGAIPSSSTTPPNLAADTGNDPSRADRCPAGPSPLALKTWHRPHVILLTSFTADGAEAGEEATTTAAAGQQRMGTSPLSVVQSLALELMRCGVHNVSVLLGGVELLKEHAPWLMVAG